MSVIGIAVPVCCFLLHAALQILLQGCSLSGEPIFAKCPSGSLFRYDHAKPAKQEELEAPSLPAPLPPAPALLAPALAAAPEPRPSGMGGPAQPPARPHSSGAVDWVHAAEFVPGQPYCGRGEFPLAQFAVSEHPSTLLNKLKGQQQIPVVFYWCL